MVLTFPMAYPVSKILDVLLGEEIGNVYNRDRLKELVRVSNKFHRMTIDRINLIELRNLYQMITYWFVRSPNKKNVRNSEWTLPCGWFYWRGSSFVLKIIGTFLT